MLDTLASVKIYLGVTVATYDDVITAMIVSAGLSMAGRDGAQRTLESGSRTEIQSGVSGYRLYLAEPVDPAGDITTIHVSSEQEWTATNLVAADDYLLDANNREIVERLDAVWPRSQRNIRVVYPIGFATTPGDVRLALWAQVARMYSAWKAAQEGRDILDTETVEGWSQKYLAHTGLDPVAADILRRYRPLGMF